MAFNVGISLTDSKLTIIASKTDGHGQVLQVGAGGSVVECLTPDQGAAGLSLTGVTASWSLSKTHLP